MPKNLALKCSLCVSPYNRCLGAKEVLGAGDYISNQIRARIEDQIDNDYSPDYAMAQPEWNSVFVNAVIYHLANKGC